MTEEKQITLCADDFAYSHAVNTGIIRLAEAKRVQAISCMTNLPLWTNTGQYLLRLNHCDIGLHLNLSEGTPLSTALLQRMPQLPPLHRLLQKIIVMQLTFSDLKQEIDAQINAFESIMGRSPDFIDGHQHVQQLPVVRTALLAVYQQRFSPLPIEQQPYLRLSKLPIVDCVPGRYKRWLINRLGASAFSQLLTQQNIPHNRYLLGSYAFGHTPCYGKTIETYLNIAKGHSILMCHPASGENNGNDSIFNDRLAEFDWFYHKPSMEVFAKHNIVLTRFKNQ